MAAAEDRSVLVALQAEVALLRAEAEIRRLVGRYMFLCDAPLAEPGMSDDARGAAIAALYTEDGVWEGVGAAHGTQFGRMVGRAEIAAFFANFYRRAPRQVFNTHYLCSEQIFPGEDAAEGRWVQFQPWVFENGEAMLRSSRLQIRFLRTAEGWRIGRYRTENLFVAPLAASWPSSLIEQSTLLGDG